MVYHVGNYNRKKGENRKRKAEAQNKFFAPREQRKKERFRQKELQNVTVIYFYFK